MKFLHFTWCIYYVNTFSGVSDHSRENSINDKKNETKLNSISWKITELSHFQKTFILFIYLFIYLFIFFFAIAASAQAWEWKNSGGGGVRMD